SVVLELRHAISAEQLGCALAAVIARHGAFRLRFTRDANGAWRQTYAAIARDASGAELPVHPLANLTAVATALQASLNLADGPLWRAALFTGDENTKPQLFLVIHHLVVD